MDFYVSAPFRVRFSETDMAGIVHFSQILRWAENAEGEFFREAGIAFIKKTAGTLSGWPRVNIRADFLAPARYDDTICVRIRPKFLPEKNASSICWEFEVVKIGETEQIIARGSWVSVCADIELQTGMLRAGKKIPEELKKVLIFFKIA